MQASTVKSARGRTPLKAARAVRAEFHKRGKKPGNLCFFYGPKVDQDWVAKSLLELASMLQAEASQEVRWYTCNPEVIVSELSSGELEGSKPDMVLQRYAGPRAIREVKYRRDTEQDPRAQRQARIQQEKAHELGYDWNWYTEEDALREKVMLMNWLSINAVLLRFRRLQVGAAMEEISRFVNAREGATVADVYAEIKLPREHVFVGLMRGHQKRALTVELSKSAFSLSTTVVPWRTS